MGLEQASKERSTSSWPARWPRILLQIYPHHQSALRMIPCALEFRNRSRRPAWTCKQMHPQLMTLFYNLLFKKSSLQKNKNSIHGVNYTLQIIHIVLLYGTEGLFFLQKYDTVAHFLHKVSFDFLRPRFSIFWGKIHALMEENKSNPPSRSPDTAAACKKSGENIFGVSIKSSGFARRSFDSLLFFSGEDYFT